MPKKNHNFLFLSKQCNRVSKSQGITVVRQRKIFMTLRKISRFVCANKKIMNFNLFYSYFFMFHKYCVIFSENFELFLAQNSKTKVLTTQKNLLLECLQCNDFKAVQTKHKYQPIHHIRQSTYDCITMICCLLLKNWSTWT